MYGPVIENISSEEGAKLEMCSTTADNSKLDSLIIADTQNALLHSKVVDISMKLYDCDNFTDELMKLQCYGDLVSGLWFFFTIFVYYGRGFSLNSCLLRFTWEVTSCH